MSLTHWIDSTGLISRSLPQVRIATQSTAGPHRPSSIVDMIESITAVIK